MPFRHISMCRKSVFRIREGAFIIINHVRCLIQIDSLKITRNAHILTLNSIFARIQIINNSANKSQFSFRLLFLPVCVNCSMTKKKEHCRYTKEFSVKELHLWTGLRGSVLTVIY